MFKLHDPARRSLLRFGSFLASTLEFAVRIRLMFFLVCKNKKAFLISSRQSLAARLTDKILRASASLAALTPFSGPGATPGAAVARLLGHSQGRHSTVPTRGGSPQDGAHQRNSR
jgi:hypothetical protein